MASSKGAGPDRPLEAPDNPEQSKAAQRPGGGGAPGTGAAEPSVPSSPGEGVTEEEARKSG